MALSPSVLVAISSGVASEAAAAQAHRVSDALTGSSVLLGAALLVVLMVLVERRTENSTPRSTSGGARRATAARVLATRGRG